MSAGSTQGTGSTFIAWNRSATTSRVRSASGSSGANNWYVASLWTMSVLTVVGWTVLTRMLSAASSSAAVRMRPTTPCLAAA
jgi:hypothetical protein